MIRTFFYLHKSIQENQETHSSYDASCNLIEGTQYISVSIDNENEQHLNQQNFISNSKHNCWDE